MTDIKTVVSVSLGSSRRDKEVEIMLLGQPFVIRREGMDGDLKRAIRRIEELDGTVDAIGIGGVDVYLYTRRDRYALRDGLSMLRAAKITRIVDGSGLKNTLERQVILGLIQSHPEIVYPGVKVLMVSGMDRFGMAEAFVSLEADMIFGDLIFSLGQDQPISNLDELARTADRLMGQIVKLPIGRLYPTGKSQDTPPQVNEKYTKYYLRAEIIAGDFHLIRKHLPPRLAGKVILTNTVTIEDVADLKSRGVAWLITTTPNLDGRSFGTNVLEAVLLTLLDKDWEQVSPADYLDLIRRLDLQPRIERLN